MRILLSIFLAFLTLALVVLSFLALLESNAWWVRMTDFPRLQYSIALVGLLAALVLVRLVSSGIRLGLAAAAVAALGYNAVKLGPYFSTSDPQVADCPADQQLSVMIANVKLENRHAEALLQLVREREPDILLALETNEWWDQRLSSLSQDMPHSVAEITGGYFGMHLLSRLPLSRARAVYPVGQDAPAILATVTLPSGDGLHLMGLHPRPPRPDQSSTGRDAQLMWAALSAREAAGPVLMAGDFNAVPWERTIERMQRIGRLADPRQVHGFLPTYDAHSWWIAWPLDLMLHQAGLSVVSLHVLPGFGSDHYPVKATLCSRPADIVPPELREEDLAEAKATIDAAISDEPVRE